MPRALLIALSGRGGHARASADDGAKAPLLILMATEAEGVAATVAWPLDDLPIYIYTGLDISAIALLLSDQVVVFERNTTLRWHPQGVHAEGPRASQTAAPATGAAAAGTPGLRQLRSL